MYNTTSQQQLCNLIPIIIIMCEPDHCKHFIGRVLWYAGMFFCNLAVFVSIDYVSDVFQGAASRISVAWITTTILCAIAYPLIVYLDSVYGLYREWYIEAAFALPLTFLQFTIAYTIVELIGPDLYRRFWIVNTIFFSLILVSILRMLWRIHRDIDRNTTAASSPDKNQQIRRRRRLPPLFHSPGEPMFEGVDDDDTVAVHA
jgi:hypothetical protein